MSYIPTALRREVYERANGRCEYCLTPDKFGFSPHEVDHITAEKHKGKTVSDNLCLSCWLCNRHKGSDLTSIDSITSAITPLFHPRNHQWEDHFELDGALIKPKTPQGRVTVELLGLNQQERVEERKLLIALGKYGV
jgi:5-methylcytosine-specific restriction endonuclease McrA